MGRERGEKGGRGMRFDSSSNRPLFQEVLEVSAVSLEFLIGLGVWDTGSGIRVPYVNQQGKRVDVKTITRFDQPGLMALNDRAVPYGVDRVEGYYWLMFLVEREWDCWTLWHHDFAALGLPSSDPCALRKLLRLEYLHQGDIVILVFADDDGMFVKGVRRRLWDLSFRGNLWSYCPGPGIRTLGELVRQHGSAGFREIVNSEASWTPMRTPPRPTAQEIAPAAMSVRT